MHGALADCTCIIIYNQCMIFLGYGPSAMKNVELTSVLADDSLDDASKDIHVLYSC